MRSARRLVAQLADEELDEELDDELELVEAADSVDFFDAESDVVLLGVEDGELSVVDEVLSELELSPVVPAGTDDDDLPRLSFLKNPLPLKVTPTGWNTFLTAITSPESGCAYSVNESSWNDCCTSIVSPVSTNLYTYVGITAARLPTDSPAPSSDAVTALSRTLTVDRGRTCRKLAMVIGMQVRSAVIPAAGLGTRFLPATKVVPKELFPIGDQPAIQLVIDEALGAGIDHIVIVSSRGKPAVKEYFEPNEALLAKLDESGKDAIAERLRAIGRDWRVSVVYQDNPRGLGHAVGCAQEAVGDEPFAVMLPDEIMGSSALLAQMNGVCASTGGSVIAAAEVARHQVSAYGVIDPAGPLSDDGVMSVKDLVEKPPIDEAPSNYIISGRYVLTADAWAEIAALQPGRGGELQLTDALRAQAARSPFHAVVSDVSRHDTGNPFGFLTASIELGLQNPELGDDLRKFLGNLNL